jgi:hypothetical protein
MFAANTYRIHLATDQDADTLSDLAHRTAQRPLEGRVLIGELDGTSAAALSLSDGRVIADDARGVDHLVANLRIRAISMWAHDDTPDLRERMLSGLPAWYRAVAVPTPAADEHGERDAELSYAMRRA